LAHGKFLSSILATVLEVYINLRQRKYENLIEKKAFCRSITVLLILHALTYSNLRGKMRNMGWNIKTIIYHSVKIAFRENESLSHCSSGSA